MVDDVPTVPVLAPPGGGVGGEAGSVGVGGGVGPGAVGSVLPSSPGAGGTTTGAAAAASC